MTANLSILLNELAAEAISDSPDPWPTLRARLHADQARSLRSFGRAQRWTLVAAVAVVLAAAISVFPGANSTESVSAAAILDRAYAAATTAGPLGAIRTYHLRATRTTRPASGMFNQQAIEAWFSAPDRRYQSTRCGDCPAETVSDVIENGGHSWSITTISGQPYVLPTQGAEANADLLLPVGSSSADLLLRAQQLACGTATLRGEATMAARSVYVVTVASHSGDSCVTAPSFSPLGRFMQGQQTDTFWIDRESYLLLGAEQHLPQGRVGQELATYTVSSVEYNTPLPDALFVYTPPAHSTVMTSAAELKSVLSRALAK